MQHLLRTCLQADHTGDHDAVCKESQIALIGPHFNAHQPVSTEKSHYYALRHSLTEIQPCRNVHVQGIPVC